MKFGLKQLLHPTPIKIRVFGKALRTAAISAAAIAATAGSGLVISIVLVAAGFLGEFLCNFFGAENVSTEVINKSNEPIKADVATDDSGNKTIVQ